VQVVEGFDALEDRPAGFDAGIEVPFVGEFVLSVRIGSINGIFG
jgi:hypothetical protein